LGIVHSVIKPRALRPGDRIAIVSPASPFSRDEFDRGVAEVRRLGFEPVYHDTVFDRSLFTSGPAELRAASFVRAWSDPGVAALMAVRGGYGSVHLLPELEGWNPAQNPKLFIAYSDNTSLHTWLTCQCGVPVIHGGMLEGRLAKGAEGYDERSLMALVTGDCVGMALEPEEAVAAVEGEVSGPLYGGTLTQLCASLGTPFAFDPPAGSVLFLEDVNERPYRVDRMLTQLKLAGVLRRARALVFGEMRGCDEPDSGWKLRELLPELLEDFDGPIITGFPSGHTSGPSWSLPLGVRVTVRATSRPAVVIEESPVE
jgi:muramoyltetrapeptide carboxypeptidase